MLTQESILHLGCLLSVPPCSLMCSIVSSDSILRGDVAKCPSMLEEEWKYLCL